MKIKMNKLLAGGLMTVVACALAGSITGTFAWYQVSNRSTVSMHGASVGSSQNLQFAWASDAPDTGTGAWSSDNLTWADIKAHATRKGATIGSGENAVNDALYPASNGANAGSAALNATWYKNPTGGTTLPEVEKEGEGASAHYVDGYFVQFTFYARYQEVSSATPNYPAATIYVDEIASKVVDRTAQNAKNATFALRMHVQMGASTYFVVNPYDTATSTVTLSSTYTEIPGQYDWSGDDNDNPAGTAVTVGLPDATTPGSLVALAHADVIQEFNSDGSLKSSDQVSKSVTTSTSAGVPITVTFWLEGFAQSDINDADSDWWDAATTVGDVLDFGFELRAVKN